MSHLSYNPTRATATALPITHLDLQQRLDDCLNPLADMAAMGLEAAALATPRGAALGRW